MADMNSTSVIDLIDVLSFAFALALYYSGCNGLAEIIEDHTSPNFLSNIVNLLGVKICQTNRIFQLSERSFNTPYADILEMPIYDISECWLI